MDIAAKRLQLIGGSKPVVHRDTEAVAGLLQNPISATYRKDQISRNGLCGLSDTRSMYEESRKTTDANHFSSSISL
jgi:hypothetical protein